MLGRPNANDSEKPLGASTYRSTPKSSEPRRLVKRGRASTQTNSQTRSNDGEARSEKDFQLLAATTESKEKPLPPLPTHESQETSATQAVTVPEPSGTKGPTAPSTIGKLVRSARRLGSLGRKSSKKNTKASVLDKDKRSFASSNTSASADSGLKAIGYGRSTPASVSSHSANASEVLQMEPLPSVVPPPVAPLSPPRSQSSPSVSPLPSQKDSRLRKSSSEQSTEMDDQSSPIAHREHRHRHVASLRSILQMTPISSGSSRSSESSIDYFSKPTPSLREQDESETPDQKTPLIDMSQIRPGRYREAHLQKRTDETGSSGDSLGTYESRYSDRAPIVSANPQLPPPVPERNPARIPMHRKTVSDSEITSASPAKVAHSPVSIQPLPTPVPFRSSLPNLSQTPPSNAAPIPDYRFYRENGIPMPADLHTPPSGPVVPRNYPSALTSGPAPSSPSRHFPYHSARPHVGGKNFRRSRDSTNVSPFTTPASNRQESPLRQEYSLSTSDGSLARLPPTPPPQFRVPVQGYFEPHGMIPIDLNDVPDHLKTSPLCPLHPKHRGGVKPYCPLHGSAAQGSSESSHHMDGNMSESQTPEGELRTKGFRIPLYSAPHPSGETEFDDDEEEDWDRPAGE
ncbi:MAG: hypothetical protein M1828_006611 [Chrysothrix sp. TS-e1954]|nr:MAG: hypothetical protein M1828_006611 [Chrysothrix sp. TS-e1954]